MYLVLFLALIAPLLQEQPPSFIVAARFVKVPVSVFDKQGSLIPDLSRDDFKLFDEGEPREIENFLLDSAPIHALLLLDVSGSLSEELQEIRRAALEFSDAFDREDRISLVSFSDKVVLLRDWTNRRKHIKKGLKKLKTGYRTALYDALKQMIETQFKGVDGRRVIIVLTDGLDNESDADLESVASDFVSSDISLYIVSRTRLLQEKVRDSARVEFLNQVMKNVLSDDGDYVSLFFKRKEATMRQLAETTGGRVFFPEHLEELTTVYSEVAEELKQQYVLTFRSPSSSEKEFHSIQLDCTRDIGRLHYRKQYRWP
jgi:VWFA-related protein